MAARLRTAWRPLDAVVTVPGSKSIANRALVCAALADGTSELTGVPDGDDTVAMTTGLGALGVEVQVDGTTAVVRGGALGGGARRVDARLAGTTSRFLTAVAALAAGPVTVDGAPPLRRRPMGPLHDALVVLGASVESTGEAGHLPVTVIGPLATGGELTLPGDVSSQYLTALMLIGPRLAGGLRLHLTTPLVSRPYVELTGTVMAAFGVGGVTVGEREVVVPAGRYVATAYPVEPDASTASYPLAMAAVAGGHVEVAGLRASSPQGDVRFADLLGRMGCTVLDGPAGLGVERDRAAALRGIDVDLAEASDLVPTLAVVAATASTPTTITGVGFIRAKESDRLADLATELGRAGARVEVLDDGLRIEPSSRLHGAVLATHDDHRLAMAFGVLGAAVAGIEVEDPGVVTKSWPDFWAVRDRLLTGPRPVVAAFDVDRTVTTRDCVVPFLRLVGGTVPVAVRLGLSTLRNLPALVRRDRDHLKAVASRVVFRGRRRADVERLGEEFAATVAASWLRLDTVARMRWHHEQGHAVVLVSASFAVYLGPLARRLGGVDAVLATELAVGPDDRCTGELVEGNCRGPEKVRRLHRWLDEERGGRSAVEVWAYGDSSGDRELLADADHAVWAAGVLAAVP